MKNACREQYDKLLSRMTNQKSAVSKVIKSCTTEDHLNSVLAWIYNLWKTNLRIIQSSYDDLYNDLALFSRPSWIDYRAELEYFCNHYFYNELVKEVKSQKAHL